ncbi:atlastin-2-like [Tetranychus urticae]|uniref:GB1/RHD3-type G domain-containing protein n=1 Tax=Tetranychus urticae TaxID=32264 RepID=T1KHU1_TETUR|nr:atlastin-2-like [Tetranychus urticae]XP_015786952.1 atlastin-2-like [Tetranychus urticae]
MATTPLPILRFDNEKQEYEFVEETFDKIIDREGIQDLPIAVVSIVGDYRKGKSTLLNFLLRYFQHYDSEDWLGNSKQKLTGFSWRQGVKRDTIGIVLWPEPLIITKKDGSKIAVILMDTQGLFDDQTTHKDCRNIFAISSLLSSIQVYNQMHMIQSNDITKLSEFSQYSKCKKEETGYKAFQDLLLLVRDWSSPVDYHYGDEGGRDYLKSMKISQSGTFKENWEVLYQSYAEINCFLMPHPGLAVNIPGFAGEITKLQPTFVSNLRQLARSYFSPEKIAIKTSRGRNMKMAEFSIFFKSIVGNLMQKNTIGIDDLGYIDSEAQAKIALMHATAEFFKQYVALNPANDPSKLALSAERACALATLVYLNMTNYIDPEIAEAYLDDWKSSVDEFVTERLMGSSNDKSKDSTDSGWRSNIFTSIRYFLYSLASPVASKVIPTVIEVGIPFFLSRFNKNVSFKPKTRRQFRKR